MKPATIIIAEAGVNHNGSMELAKRLIDAAADAGADFVKFQTFHAGRLASAGAKKAGYQAENVNDGDDSQSSMLRKLELSPAMHEELIGHCRKRGIRFLSTGFDEESIDMLVALGVPFLKIPSGEITNKPYLQHIAGKGKPVILSTGMATMKEVEEAVRILTDGGADKEQLTVLHCNSGYPTPMQDVNLKAMLTMGETLKVKVGYSDHTLGIEVPVAAVALGASIVEKHFTLDRNLPGPDHQASLEPAELKAMVAAIRNVELALSGDGLKRPTPSELPNLAAARKSIHLARAVRAGEVITLAHLAMKRPGDGISPMDVEKVTGKKARLDLEADSKLTWEAIGD